VGRIEAALAGPLAAVTRSGAQFSREQSAGSSAITGVFKLSPEPGLLKALAQIRALRARLAALTTPPPAVRLRALLLELIDGQAGMTREVAELVAFLPRYNAGLGALGPATTRLKLALSQRTARGAAAVAAVYAAKAAALRQFQASVDKILAQLRRLRPPAVSEPSYRAQLASLEGMGTSAGRLAAALASGGGTSNVQPLLQQFDRAAASSRTVAVQKEEIAAVRAYNSRSAALTRLSQAVAEEHQRLAERVK
jgi:hypothetical protein